MRRMGTFLAAAALLAGSCVGGFAQESGAAQAPIVVDAHAKGTPFPHFWEEMFGSGRANLAMRQSYRDDIQRVRKVTDFQYVRFHAILDDENGVYSEDKEGNAVYNWSYVDHIYDGLLANGIKPFVEISFMPKALAAKVQYHAFWYKPIPSPPANYDKWDALITAFAKHLIDRYGIDEVASWYFEVWNEPNIDFWIGQAGAVDLLRAVRSHGAGTEGGERADPRGRSGDGAGGVGRGHDSTRDGEPCATGFCLDACVRERQLENVFGDNRTIAPHQMVCAAVDKVHAEIEHSARPKIPLIWSEFNATYMNQQEITDSIYMGPWMADTISKCDGKTLMMSYWSFSDVFEEQGVVKRRSMAGTGLWRRMGFRSRRMTILSCCTSWEMSGCRRRGIRRW